MFIQIQSGDPSVFLCAMLSAGYSGYSLYKKSSAAFRMIYTRDIQYEEANEYSGNRLQTGQWRELCVNISVVRNV